MIVVKDVTAQYGKNVILKDVNIEITPGKRIAFTGRNGSGKSTLLQIMAGILPAATGTISYFGEDVTKNKKRFSHYCGYVPQDNPLLEDLSVMDNLCLWNGGRTLQDENILKMNGLEELLDKKVSTLSGGMKRRLSIACAMLHMPPVMLMDEPTTALDDLYKSKVWEWMDEYQKLNGTIVMITHDKEEMESCDAQYIINDSTVVLKEN